VIAKVLGMMAVLISFERPASMSESEMRAWITRRAMDHQLALVLSRSDGSANQSRLLRVEVRADSIEATEEKLTDLMLDMRLLGLRPMVESPPA
jgi:hypothetical protein